MKKLYNFFKKVFNPKSGTYSFLLGLMSFLAILISLLTLQEMKTQRELSMMPIIRIQNPENLLLEVDSICSETLFTSRIALKTKGERPKVFAIDEELFKLDLVNVGEGSAVNVAIDWQIDFNGIVQDFEALGIDSLQLRMDIKEEAVFYNYKNCDGAYSAKVYSTQITERKSHLLPASNQNEGEKVRIPSIILEFLVNAIRAEWIMIGQNAQNVFEPENLETHISIKYESVLGNVFSDHYKISFGLTPGSIKSVSLLGGSRNISASYQDFILELKIEKM
ncbi:MAG: hypothetical protein AAGD28_04230 [Bacteroidota bacterium]